MRTKLRKYLSLAAATVLCTGAKAINQVDGVYQIATAQDWNEFATLVADGNTGIDAVLTADIDISEYHNLRVGTENNKFAGTLDGQNHTLKVDLLSTDIYTAPFAYLSGTVKNLKVDGTISVAEQGHKYAAGIAGYTDGCTVENCIVNVDIYSQISGATSDDADGTHGGFFGYASNGGTVRNSAFTGAFISQTTTSCAGICGWVSSDGETLNVDRCLMIADISQWVNTDGCSTFARNSGMCNITNSVYVDAFGEVPSGATQVTADQLASGAACFILNGLSTEGCTWFQNLGTDDMPVTDATHQVVYANGKVHCNGDLYPDVTYNNASGTLTHEEHNYVDGVCDYCGAADENFVAVGADGYYEISNAHQLVWIAARISNGNLPDANIRLTAPIDLTGETWCPIGSVAHPYSGTFEGNLQPVSGLTKPLFGTTSTANISGVAIESGDITGDATYAAHTGTIIGHTTGLTVLERSYTKAAVVAAQGDAGGFIGKMGGNSIMRNCYFAGNITSGWSAGCIIGSAESGNTIAEISNIIVDGSNVTYGNGDGHALSIGWSHENVAQYLKNIYIIESPTLTDVTLAGDGNAPADVRAKCTVKTAEDLATGELTWLLNGESFVNTVWRQTLDEDQTPVLDATHGIVYKVDEGQYTNDMAEMRESLSGAYENYLDNVVACQADIDACKEALEVAVSASNDEEFAEAYTTLQAARAQVEASEAAYAAYSYTIDEIMTYMEEHAAELSGPSFDRLDGYIYGDAEPGDDGYPNGCVDYIKEHHMLTAAEIGEERTYANALLEDAIRGGFAAGSEITRLVINADLNDATNFNGWETSKSGSTLTVMRGDGFTYTAEAWNATFDVHQTLTGLPNGIYELRADAAFRAANNDYDGNDNYTAFLYAGDQAVYVQTAGEDLIAPENAVDKVNSWLVGDGNIDKLYDNGIVTGYYPVGPVGCYYAFGAGRYQNRIVCNVTDGTLTIGIKNVGTGLENDWCGFDNFRLFYLGSTEEAADGIVPTLEGMAARAATAINYICDAGEEYTRRPNYSQDLRDRLQQAIEAVETATTGEERLALVSTFTALFQEVYDCKQAYIALADAAQTYYAAVYQDEEATDEEKADMEVVVGKIMANWEEGAYTMAEALAMDDLKQTAFYQRLSAGAPDMVDGVYQIGNAEQLLWLATATNKLGMTGLKAVITAPIDLTDVEWTPIGIPSAPFRSEFDGQLYPITGLSKPLFGTTGNCTIKGVAIESGSISGDATYAAHTGAIIGHTTGVTVLERSYTKAAVVNAVGDAGGMIGKMAGGATVRNCYFAGDLTAGWSAGCVAGSSDGSGSVAEISNVYVDARNVHYANGDGHALVVGWIHNNVASQTSNVYVIAGAELTNIADQGQDSSPADMKEKCLVKTVEEFASGEIAWLLNNGEEDAPVWFQTLGEDETPVLAPAHAIVIKNEDGTYSNKTGDAIDIVDMEQRMSVVNVYDMNGRQIRSNVKPTEALKGLPAGMYIMGGKKLLKK